MSAGGPRDVAASVRARLLQLSRERGEDFQITLIRFAVERLLFRLSQSAHRNQFVLKGAMLFTLWQALPHRSTRDLDLLGRGDNDPEALVKTFRAILATTVESDGLQFDAESISAEPLHEGQDYEGIRVFLDARLDRAEIPLQIDIAFGQAVVPGPTEEDFPTLLGHPRARLLAYPREVVVAEKFQAITVLGMTNSRMKDFFDVAYIARSFEFDAAQLARALSATFDRRQSPLPAETPLALTESYFGAPERKRDWDAFKRRAGLAADAVTLESACGKIEEFVMPVCGWIRNGPVPDLSWKPGSGWEA